MARTPITKWEASGMFGGDKEYARRRDQDEPKGEAVSRDCGLRGANWEERIKPGRWVSKCLIIMGPE